MTITNIKTPFRRELIVENGGSADTYLHVKGDDWGNKHDVKTYLPEQQVNELITALLGDNATVITDLPEAKEDGFGYVAAGSYDRSQNTDPEQVLKNAKALLAIHKFLVEKQAKEAEVEAQRIKEAELAAKAAKRAEDARNWRKDALAKEFRGFGNYDNSSVVFKKAIDRIVELETATA